MKQSTCILSPPQVPTPSWETKSSNGCFCHEIVHFDKVESSDTKWAGSPLSQKLLKRISSFCGGFLSAAYSALPLFLKRSTSPYFLVLTPLLPAPSSSRADKSAQQQQQWGRFAAWWSTQSTFCAPTPLLHHRGLQRASGCWRDTPPSVTAATFARALGDRSSAQIEAIPCHPTLMHIFEDFDPPCPELWS